MSLKKGHINALNVLDARRLSYVPKHFATMTVNIKYIGDVELINVWMYQNLSSRYAIRQVLKTNIDNKVVEVHEIGVEDSKELTIMSLTCPYLDR